MRTGRRRPANPRRAPRPEDLKPWGLGGACGLPMTAAVDTHTEMPLPGPRGDDRIRVLLVEDQSEAARLVRRRLEWSRLARFEVVHRACLDDALALLERQSFDAMLLDLHLPDCDGLAAVPRARALATGLPIAWCSPRGTIRAPPATRAALGRTSCW